MNMDWMYWTRPTAVFFIFIFLLLAAMGVWQVISPTRERRGFLPITTTRGDRLFIGLLGTAYIHLAWIGLTDASLWIALSISFLWVVVEMRWG